jgi:mannose-6-phosphate isomerase-like protein (cupin superfamily)
LANPDISRYLRIPDMSGDTDAKERWSARLLTADQGELIRTCSYIRTPPGKGSWRGMHTHEFDQLYYILEGTLTMQIGEEVFDAPTGSLVVIPAGTVHENSNRTHADVVQLMVESRERVPDGPGHV